MAEEACPKCGARVQQTDALCMDCGADLLEERRKVERTIIETARLPVAAATAPRTAAASGAAEVGERSEETRLRIFDKQLAEALAGERLTAFVTAGIAFILLAVLLFSATHQIQAAGGFSGLRTVTPSGIRHLRWAVFTDNAVTGMWLGIATVASSLCLIGQTWRGIVAGKCIQAVEAGEKPVLVGVSTATTAGLLLFGVICPPVGIIFGLILRLRPDADTAAFGGMLMWASFIALLLFGVNSLWGLAEGLKTRLPQERKVPEAPAQLLYPLWAVACAMLNRVRRSYRSSMPSRKWM